MMESDMEIRVYDFVIEINQIDDHVDYTIYRDDKEVDGGQVDCDELINSIPEIMEHVEYIRANHIGE